MNSYQTPFYSSSRVTYRPVGVNLPDGNHTARKRGIVAEPGGDLYAVTVTVQFETILKTLEGRPERLEPGTRSVRRVETHISVVLLTDSFVFKFKKPVVFPFIAQARLEERLFFCLEEVRLGARLAPAVYLGVRGVHEAGPGGGLRLDENLEDAREYCVVMRRLSDADSLLARARSGAVDAAMIEAVARTLADFHRDCPPAAPGLYDFDRNLEDNLAAIAEAGLLRNPEIIDRIRAFAARGAPSVRRRLRRGRVVDGHGDLRLDHIYVADGPAEDPGHIQIIDCVEFSPTLRAVDPYEDLAFVTLGLDMEGLPWAGRRLACEYLSRGLDVDGFFSLRLFEIYRATVRAKIDAIQFASATGSRPAYFQERFVKYMELVERLLDDDARPASASTATLIVVGGLPATGKSTHARRLARRLEAPVIATDLVRKRLAGIRPERSAGRTAFAGAYRPNRTVRVYTWIRALAARLLRQGRSVIVEGTFSKAWQRALFVRLGQAGGFPVEFQRVLADETVVRKRLDQRAVARTAADVSDLVDFDVWCKLRDQADAWPAGCEDTVIREVSGDMALSPEDG